MEDNGNNTNWLQLLRELEREEMELRSQPGDLDLLKDFNFIIKHPGEAKDVIEARGKRQGREAKIRHEAAKMKLAIAQAKERAEKEALEAYALANVESFALSINGERVRKFKRMDDLRCPHCKEPMPAFQGVVLSAAEDLKHRAEHVRAGRGLPFYQIQNTKCGKCREMIVLRCQSVIV